MSSSRATVLVATLAIAPLLHVAACGGSGAPPASTLPAPVVSAYSAPVAVLPEPPPAADSASAAAPAAPAFPERTPMPFCVVGRFPSTPRLFRLDDATLLMATSQPAAVCDRAGTCAAVPDSANLPADLALGGVVAAGGHWSRDVWLTLTRRMREGSQDRVVHFAAGRWREEARPERGYVPLYTQLATSPDGRVAGIATFKVDGVHATAAQMNAGPAQLYRLDVLAGALGAGLPVLHKGDTPFAVALLRNGESLVVLDRAAGEEGHVVAVRRGAGGIHEIALPLPADVAGRELEVTSLDASTAGVGFAAGHVTGVLHGYLARIETDKATSLDVPDAVGVIADISVEPDETAWVLASGGLFVRSPVGRWEHVTVAAEPGGSCTAGEVEVRAAGDVFVSAKCDSGHTFVLRTRCPTPELPEGP